jgi:hypothetical protein
VKPLEFVVSMSSFQYVDSVCGRKYEFRCTLRKMKIRRILGIHPALQTKSPSQIKIANRWLCLQGVSLSYSYLERFKKFLFAGWCTSRGRPLMGK